MIDQIRLSSKVTVQKYREMEKLPDKLGLARFIDERLRERHITPLKAIPRSVKNGFAVMAVCCLLIETLEAFYQGWEATQTKGRSRDAFRNFFNREDRFSSLNNHAGPFYGHVRCGILHQGETTGGWRVRRTGPFFDQSEKTINATKFHNAASKALDNYKNELIGSGWDSPLWKNFRKKMNKIIKNCGRRA